MLRIRIWTNPILNGFLSYHASHSGQLIVELWCGSAPKQKGLAHKVVLQMTRAGIGDPETLLTQHGPKQNRRCVCCKLSRCPSSRVGISTILMSISRATGYF